jgi:glucose/arabinose dehydrogenase
MNGARIGLAVLVAGAFAAPALAQQAPAAPPAWQQGRPADMAGSTLAPHPPRLTVTPVDRIPVASLRVPEGFRVELWHHGMPGIRRMVRAADGTIFAGTRVIGRIYAIRDSGSAREHMVWAQGLTQPDGLALRDGALYVSALSTMLRYDNARYGEAPTPVNLTAAFGLPPEQHHAWKHIAFGPDGKLYVPVGAPCNICAPPSEDTHAVLLRFNPDGSGREIVARGVRNTVGFDFHPQTGQVWFSNHGRDWAGNDTPQDSLHVAARIGAHHGFPFCMGGWQDPGFAARGCSEFEAPAALLGPHTAPIGTRFYTGTMFPEAYRGRLFVALRGSWNRERLAGFEFVTVRLEGDRVAGIEPFLTGLRDDAANRFLGRPADMLTLPDGSMLFTDEENGAIYRVTYGR